MNTKTLNIRGLHYHIQEWGDPSKPLLVLLHGWMDCGATFKYMVEYLRDHYFLIAPDWRGFGQTDHVDGYWFADYFADLEKILDYYSPNDAADMVGHSMGGNIALMYAGIQPHRVKNVMSLEGLGMPQTEANEAPKKYRRWLREITSEEPTKIYPDFDSLCLSVKKGNPRLAPQMIIELAHLWGKAIGDEGAYKLKHDHAHRYTNPVRYNFDDVLECWQEITANVGLVMAKDSRFYQRFSKFGRLDEAISVLNITDSNYFVIDDCGHMVHIEQPKLTADAILSFLNGVSTKQ